MGVCLRVPAGCFPGEVFQTGGGLSAGPISTDCAPGLAYLAYLLEKAEEVLMEEVLKSLFIMLPDNLGCNKMAKTKKRRKKSV